MSSKDSQRLAMQLLQCTVGYSLFDAMIALSWAYGRLLAQVEESKVDQVLAGHETAARDARRIALETELSPHGEKPKLDS